MAKRIHTVTFQGQTFTRSSTSRTYSHAILGVAKDGKVGAYGWSSSKALAEKAAATYRGWNTGDTIHVVPVDAVTEQKPRAVPVKERTAEQGPTPRQMDYLRHLAGLGETTQWGGMAGTNGNAQSRLHAAVVKMGWAERVKVDGMTYAQTQLTEAGRVLLGLTAELPELVAEIDAHEVTVELVEREMGAGPAGYARPGTAEYAEEVRHNARRNARRFLLEARVAYTSRNQAAVQVALASCRQALEKTGVVLATTPAPEPTPEQLLEFSQRLTAAKSQAEPMTTEAAAQVDQAVAGMAEELAERKRQLELATIHPGDRVRLVDGREGTVNHQLGHNGPRTFLVLFGKEVDGYANVQVDQLARVLVRYSAIREAQQTLEQVVGALADLNPSLGLAFSYTGGGETWGDTRCWSVFSQVALPDGKGFASFGGVHTWELPQLLAQVTGQDPTRGQRWRSWFAHLVGATQPAYHPARDFSQADLDTAVAAAR